MQPLKITAEFRRPDQKIMIQLYIVNGRDVLFYFQTGSGKSLTFEIAPFVFHSEIEPS